MFSSSIMRFCSCCWETRCKIISIFLFIISYFSLSFIASEVKCTFGFFKEMRGCSSDERLELLADSGYFWIWGFLCFIYGVSLEILCYMLVAFGKVYDFLCLVSFFISSLAISLFICSSSNLSNSSFSNKSGFSFSLEYSELYMLEDDSLDCWFVFGLVWDLETSVFSDFEFVKSFNLFKRDWYES